MSGRFSELADVLAMTGCRDRADLEDMANVGKSLMEAIGSVTKHGRYKGWMPADDPAEIVTDMLNDLEEAEAKLTTSQARQREMEAALVKINALRNSIIGLQSINWSEHIYPLVAALNDVGFDGMKYPEALANYGTMLERTNAAEQRVQELEEALRNTQVVLRHVSLSRRAVGPMATTALQLTHVIAALLKTTEAAA